MEEKTKKELMELGIGVASIVAAEVLGTTILKMKKEGKLNKKEAEKMMRDTMAQARSAGTKYAAVAHTQLNRVIEESPFATKKEIARLNAKIDRLTKLAKSGKRGR